MSLLAGVMIAPPQAPEWETLFYMAYICKTPGCGEDLTAEVMRKLSTTGMMYRSKDSLGRRVDPVHVACSKGHRHLYP